MRACGIDHHHIVDHHHSSGLGIRPHQSTSVLDQEPHRRKYLLSGRGPSFETHKLLTVLQYRLLPDAKQCNRLLLPEKDRQGRRQGVLHAVDHPARPPHDRPYP